MKMSEITENIDNLKPIGMFGNPTIGYKKVKQNLLLRVLKKISLGSLLAIFGGGLGAAFSGGVGALAGMAAGITGAHLLTGPKYKEVAIKLKGKDAKEYIQQVGLDKDLEPFYERYFSKNAVEGLNVNPDHIAAVLAKESGLLDTGASFFSLKADIEYISREQALLLSERGEMKIIRDHLYSASKSLEKIAEKYGLQPRVVSELFSIMYGDSPINLFFINLTGSNQIHY